MRAKSATKSELPIEMSMVSRMVVNSVFSAWTEFSVGNTRPKIRTVQADMLAPAPTGTSSENLAHFVRMDPRRKGHGGQTVYRTGTLKDRCEPILLFECCAPDLCTSSRAPDQRGNVGRSRRSCDQRHGRREVSSIASREPEGKLRRCLTDAEQSPGTDRKSTRLNSSHGYISYAVFCLKKKKKTTQCVER